MIRCVLLHCWWKCGERESGSGIDLPCSMTPCYFSRLCGQRFRELVNGKWESERSGGEERKRDTYRQKDCERERRDGGLYNVPVNIMFISAAADAADYGISWSSLRPFSVRHEERQHAFNENDLPGSSCLSLFWGMLVVLSNSTANVLHLTQWTEHVQSPDTVVNTYTNKEKACPIVYKCK